MRKVLNAALDWIGAMTYGLAHLATGVCILGTLGLWIPHFPLKVSFWWARWDHRRRQKIANG